MKVCCVDDLRLPLTAWENEDKAATRRAFGGVRVPEATRVLLSHGSWPIRMHDSTFSTLKVLEGPPSTIMNTVPILPLAQRELSSHPE
jgi:hypothetical protein